MKHLPRTAWDFIIPLSLCLILPGAQRRATENCENSTFVVICCLYTKIRGKGEVVFPCLLHMPPPLSVTPEEGPWTEWTAHNSLGATDHNKIAPFKQGSTVMPFWNLFIRLCHQKAFSSFS